LLSFRPSYKLPSSPEQSPLDPAESTALSGKRRRVQSNDDDNNAIIEDLIGEDSEDYGDIDQWMEQGSPRWREGVKKVHSGGLGRYLGPLAI
jgi:hypothetical protein